MSKFNLRVEDLEVASFAVVSAPESQALIAQPADSWPAVCTCIGICEPSADVYCSGGCPPFAVAQPVVAQPVGVAKPVAAF
ncbi:MAG TPA: hypothetical protein VFQ39_18695 [Longimicrobium sp.]|nr:hypothetical protein [Longimicrobium sp.]